jgi:hypothetical protein
MQQLYIVLRRAMLDAPPEYYAGNHYWTTEETAAKPLRGGIAAMLCENFTTRHGYCYTFSFLPHPRQEEVKNG